MIFLQIILFLALYTGMVAFAVRDGAVNALYFYPKPVQERAFAIGLAGRKDIRRKSVRFMISFLSFFWPRPCWSSASGTG